jgi:hypothetical protein
MNFMIQRFDGPTKEGTDCMWSDTLWFANIEDFKNPFD